MRDFVAIESNPAIGGHDWAKVRLGLHQRHDGRIVWYDQSNTIPDLGRNLSF